MNIVWLSLDIQSNERLEKYLNQNENCLVCDFSPILHLEKFKEISYFDFCNLQLRKSLGLLGDGDSSGNLILTNLDWTQPMQHNFEMLYLFSIVLPLDPILVATENARQTLEEKNKIKFRRFVDFDPIGNFLIDLDKGIQEQENKKSDLAQIISVFNAYGTILSLGDIKNVVRLKTNVGQQISYEEFLHEIYSDNSKISDIYTTALVREHSPVDLFVNKMLKAKK